MSSGSLVEQELAELTQLAHDVRLVNVMPNFTNNILLHLLIISSQWLSGSNAMSNSVFLLVDSSDMQLLAS